MIGLPEEAILSMLKKDIRESKFDEFSQILHNRLIPNIAEVIAANNEAILFALENESTYDSKY